MDSPRGRIYQMLQVDEGRLALGESFVTHIDRCLGCLNCQTACPSGVPYGSLLERARAQIDQNYRRPWLQRKLREHFYGNVLPSFDRLALAAQADALLSALRVAGLVAGHRFAEASRHRGAGRARRRASKATSRSAIWAKCSRPTAYVVAGWHCSSAASAAWPSRN